MSSTGLRVITSLTKKNLPPIDFESSKILPDFVSNKKTINLPPVDFESSSILSDFVSNEKLLTCPVYTLNLP